MAATQDHADALAAVRKEVSTANAGKENAVPEPAQPASDLAKMFQEGTDAIATCRSADLFKQLESRSLTKEEQNIVTQRVALQRKMFQEYEKRERKRKVAEILSFCQDVTEEEALKALEFCNDREDEAAGQLASDPAFRRRCQAACGSQAPPARSAAAGASKSASWAARPSSTRPKKVDASLLGDQVFVGSFRGRGAKPAPKARAPAAKAQRTAAAAAEALEAPTDEPLELEPDYADLAGPSDAEAADLDTAMAEAVLEQGNMPDQEQQHGQDQDQEQQDDPDTAQGPHDQETAQGPDAMAAAVETAGAAHAEEEAVTQEAGGKAPSAAEPCDVAAIDMDSSPVSKPKLFKLAKCLSDGTVRSATESEIRRLCPNSAQDSGSGIATAVVASAPAETPTSGKPAAKVDGAATGTKLQPKVANAAVRVLVNMEEAAALRFLKQMKGTTAEDTLLALEAINVEKAAALRSALQAALAAAGPSEAPMPAQAATTSDGALRAFAAEVSGLASRPADSAEQLAAVPTSGTTAAAATRAAAAAPQAAIFSEGGDEASADQPAPKTAGKAKAGAARKKATSATATTAGKGTKPARAAKPAKKPAKTPGPPKGGPSKQQPSIAQLLAGTTAKQLGTGPAQHSADGASASPSVLPTVDEPATAAQLSPAGLDAKVRGLPGSDSAVKAAERAGVHATPAAGAEEAHSVDTHSEGAATDSDDDFQDAASAAAGKKKSTGKKRQGRRGKAATNPKQPLEMGKAAVAEPREDAIAVEEAAAAPDTEMADAAADEAGPSGSNPGDAAAKPAGAAAQPKGGKAKGKSGAISRTGHTCRGRVKQKASKNAVLLEVGKLRAEKGWYNAGYIFPEGFKSRINFRSSVDIDQITIYECSVLGPGGQHWPQPTFQLVGMDRPDEVIIGKSCTACWTAAQKRINSEIEARRKAGEDLPPPPKTAIAGPEYFGFGQAEILEVIETLDPDHLCDVYWEGKEDRQAAMQGLPAPERAPRAERGASASGSGVKRTRAPKRRRGESDEEEEEAMNEDEDECQYMTNRWSAVSRTERYRKRCEADGDGGPVVDEKNPLPGLIDPITLEPVVTPAISPFGHVMGMATWKAVLAEHGKCPFTKQPLSWESCTVLSLSNIDRYRDRIK